jgi:hypothetical protein
MLAFGMQLSKAKALARQTLTLAVIFVLGSRQLLRADVVESLGGSPSQIPPRFRWEW